MNAQNESDMLARASVDDLRDALRLRECAEADHPPCYEERTVDEGLARVYCRCGAVTWNRDDRP